MCKIGRANGRAKVCPDSVRSHKAATGAETRKAETMAGRWAGLAFLLLCPALALESVRILDLAEYNRRQSSRVEQGLHLLELVQIKPDLESLQHIRIQLERLADLSLPVTPFLYPCHSCLPDQCKAHQVRPYPLLPLAVSYRDAMLGRPPLEVARANIEAATEGELSTVGELVTRVIGSLDHLHALRDDELTVLASNFHTSKTGWVLGVQSLAMDYGSGTKTFWCRRMSSELSGQLSFTCLETQGIVSGDRGQCESLPSRWMSS